MSGTGGDDRLRAALAPDEAALAGSPGGLGLDLRLTATKPAALHDRDGWIDFGPAGGSYYYSRTAMTATGSLDLDGRSLAVEGVGLVRPPVGRLHLGRRRRLGLVRGQPRRRHRPDALARARRRRLATRSSTARSSTPTGPSATSIADAFTVEVTDRWMSPATGADYPAGWTIRIPGEDLDDRRSQPTVAAQELDTRATTGVIYWEGSQVVRATRAGTPLGGQGYVELTGYAATVTAGS